MCYCKFKKGQVKFLGKYRLVQRTWREDIVCGDCNQDLDREKRQGEKLAFLVHEQVIFDNIRTFHYNVFIIIVMVYLIQTCASFRLNYSRSTVCKAKDIQRRYEIR